jgi:hypothetical protein
MAAFAGSRAREAIGEAVSISGESFASSGGTRTYWELAPTHRGIERAGSW